MLDELVSPPLLLLDELDPGMHAPASQVPAGQAEPSGFGGAEHFPVCESHVPTSWQASIAVHTTGLCPVQIPLWQRSTFVHASPSSHTDPSGTGGVEHCPVCGSHVPAA